MSARPHGYPVDASTRERLRALVQRRGEREAARALGVADRTLVRAIAGFGLYPGTRALMSQRLRELEAA
jgi:hypothetical protein